MFNKLCQNYQLSSILVRLAFVLMYAFYSWQDYLSNVQYLRASLGSDFLITDTYAVLLAVFVALLIGMIIMFLVPVVTNLFLNWSRFVNVPRSEFALLAQLFCTMHFAVCGVLRLLNLITPIFMTWGSVLFPFVTSLGFVIWFYHVTSRLYFNDVTRPYYFRNVAIAYFVCAVVFGVVL